ncbi:protein snail homolog Sna-like [Saccostrea echinata]|uniref:protein snail homolog Sna-like n=1 Tax=Saccostrea echinata TaxID=191078 RepID=UPI002A7FA07A|nr:protein snail homolog Sna-like [Saccostrea echinata]
MEDSEQQDLSSCPQKATVKTEPKPRDPIREILDSLCNKPSNPDKNGESSTALVTSNVDMDTSAFTPVMKFHSSVRGADVLKSYIPSSDPFKMNFTDWYSQRLRQSVHHQNFHQYPYFLNSVHQPNNPFIGYFSGVSSWLCKRTDLNALSFCNLNKCSTLSIPATPRYQCDHCKKSYSTFGGLSKHKQFHCTTQVKKDFSCKFCGKTYGSLGALKMHIRTHTLPCKCKICGKAFSRPWLLQGHMRTHTGEKPFSCAHCGRAFADRSNLRAHLQTHSDVKKYGCKSCKKTFSRMSLLAKHREGRICQLPVQ